MPTPANGLESSHGRIRWLLTVVLALLAVPGVVYFLLAPSLSGRLLAVILVAGCALPVAALQQRTRRVVPLSVITFILLAAATWLAIRTPTGQSLPGSGLASRLPVADSFHRWSPLNILPEIDQMYLGTLGIGFIDPLLDWQGAARVRAIMMPAYQAMENDPEYRTLGSLSHIAVDDLLGLPWQRGHTFEYVPPHAPGERMPAVLFLHGALGNFKIYFWEWRQFADRYHCIVVLPSFGAGNWREPGGIEAVEEARRHLVRDLPVDPSRIFLAGLSNGGIGVTRAAAHAPAEYAGLVLISAVIEKRTITQPSFVSGWNGRPVLLLHGAEDDRVGVAGATAAAKILRANHVDVSMKVFPDQDHFLIMSRREEVMREIGTWVDRTTAVR